MAVNSHVTGSGDVTLKSGNDTTLKGAVVSGDTVKADVGGDLAIVSAPDTGKSSNSSASGGLSLGGALGSSPSVSGVQIGGGKMEVTVGGNTHLGAGKIVSDSGDLKLSTETLTHENFDGAKKHEGFNANLGIDLTGGKGTSANPVGNSTLEGNYKLDDTRQEVNATVGPGEIEVRNEEKQAALEKDGTATLPLATLGKVDQFGQRFTADIPITGPNGKARCLCEPVDL